MSEKRKQDISNDREKLETEIIESFEKLDISDKNTILWLIEHINDIEIITCGEQAASEILKKIFKTFMDEGAKEAAMIAAYKLAKESGR